MRHTVRLFAAALLLSFSVGCHHRMHHGGGGCPDCGKPCGQHANCPQHRDCPERKDCPKHKDCPNTPACPNCPQKGAPAAAPQSK